MQHPTRSFACVPSKPCSQRRLLLEPGLGKAAFALQTGTSGQGNATAAEFGRGTAVLVPKLSMQPLSALMAALGHDWIDVLKVDVEGLEWQIMESWLAAWDVLPFTQLQVCALHLHVASLGQAPHSAIIMSTHLEGYMPPSTFQGGRVFAHH